MLSSRSIQFYGHLFLRVRLRTVKEVQKLIELRMKNFQNNSLIKEANIDISEPTEDNYNRAVEILSAECEKVRKKYVNQMFYSTAISQNGFLDAIIILSSSVNMIKEIFTVYNGRVANRELIIIGKKGLLLCYYRWIRRN
jgi:hypothetical protein